jgi:hypothetical protein
LETVSLNRNVFTAMRWSTSRVEVRISNDTKQIALVDNRRGGLAAAAFDIGK